MSDHLGRDAKDFAIERAGNLANAVERLLESNRSRLDAKEWSELSRLLYEFRQRVAKIK
jgi:hypothetical protein